MKIKSTDLQILIKEEAVRLYKLEKLENLKNKIKDNISLISEGNEISDDEFNSLIIEAKKVLSL